MAATEKEGERERDEMMELFVGSVWQPDEETFRSWKVFFYVHVADTCVRVEKSAGLAKPSSTAAMCVCVCVNHYARIKWNGAV